MKRREVSGAVEEEVLIRKRRKLCFELEDLYCSDAESSVSSAASVEDGGSSDVVKKSVVLADLESVDLLSGEFEAECFRSIGDDFSRSSSPASGLCGYSENVLTAITLSKKKSSSRKLRPGRDSACSREVKMPSAAEIEDFFSAAETYEQKRFSEKFNFDVENDVPLEGKYEWVRVHP